MCHGSEMVFLMFQCAQAKLRCTLLLSLINSWCLLLLWRTALQPFPIRLQVCAFLVEARADLRLADRNQVLAV